MAFGAFCLLSLAALVLVMITFKIRHTLKFLITWECVILFIKIATSVLHSIACSLAAVARDR